MKALATGLLILSSTMALASYEDHFPEYFEYCTATQLKYQPEYFGGSVGGPGGHGFMYIHGLCKDYSKSYPQVVPCQSDSNHQGVGVSLDSDYSNVAWVAVPGRDLMMNGNLDPKAVTEADVNALAEKAVELKIFENVKMKPEYVSKNAFNTPEHEKAAAIYSIGTDIAVTWGRELRCVRIPVNKSAIQAAADFLNDVNNKYYKNNVPYEWSMVKNNCTHLAMNTSAAMGINPKIKTDGSTVAQIFNLGIPANAYLMYADRAILNKVNEKEIYKSKPFKNFGFHPTQLGSLMIHQQAFPDNVMFKTSELVAITLPRKNVLKLLATPIGYNKHATPENTELQANAQKWKAIYSELQSKEGHDEFNAYLEQQRSLADAIIEAAE